MRSTKSDPRSQVRPLFARGRVVRHSANSSARSQVGSHSKIRSTFANETLRCRRRNSWREMIPSQPESLAPNRAMVEQVEKALADSGYPLHQVRCECDDHTLILSGRASRYFYLQVALTAAMALAGHRRVTVNIQVVPTATSPQFGPLELA